jgi:hypothetical protein
MTCSKLLHWPTVLALLAATLTFGGCGESSESQSLEEHVHAAMSNLSYEYKVLPRRGTKDYVVLYVSDGKRDVGRFVAVGLPGRSRACPTPPPKLPAAYGVEGVTYGESGKGSLCEAEVNHRATPKGQKRAKMMMGHKVVLAVWEQIYGTPACWADRSCST